MGFQTLAELNTGDVLPETWVDQVKENFEVLKGSAVTSLPVGADYQVVRFYPNGAGSQPVWTCVFDPDLNGGAGAWAASGPALRGSVLTSQSTTSSSPTDLSTPGPSVVIPCAGRYVVRIEADLYNTTGGVTVSGMDVQGPGLAAGGGGPVVITGNTQRRTSASEEEVEFTGAGTVICKYSVSGGTGVFQRRRIAVWPVELRP